MAKKFYKCAKCGNIISKYVDSGVPVVCCGEPMMELVANSTDAAGESKRQQGHCQGWRGSPSHD